MRYILATHNKDKIIEMSRILEPLGIEAVTDRDLGIELPEVDETGTTFAENAYLKAASACEFTGLPAVADDSGIVVDALDDAPGNFQYTKFQRRRETTAIRPCTDGKTLTMCNAQRQKRRKLSQ